MPDMSAPWLADEVCEAFESVPGGTERIQIVALIGASMRIRLAPALCAAAALTVRLAPLTIEANLGSVCLLGHESLWLEYTHADRVSAYPGSGGVSHGPHTVGCLLTRNPESPSRVAIFVSWRTHGGGVFHSYAILHWDLAAMAAAPRSGLDSDCEVRLAGLGGTSIPPGMMDELEIWQDIKAANDPALGRSIAQTTREAFGEHHFLLSTLLLLGSSAVAFDDSGVDGGPLVANLKPSKSRRTLWSKGGFRLPLFGSILAWQEPTSGVAKVQISAQISV